MREASACRIIKVRTSQVVGDIEATVAAHLLPVA